ncbi:MAG: hypothetical protein E6R05_03005 [Candidatus Moraniibacteriota bacterium]|nr:MAG: hypothetical protein E6R05_03005 [Candidatus Moranbacteria bacterium]
MNLATSKYFVATKELVPPLLTIIASISCIYLLFFSTYFQITDTRCRQDDEDTCQNNHISSQLNTLIGQNIFLVNTNSLENTILNADPTIRTLSFKRNLPGNLTLEMYTVYPLVALTLPQSETLFVLDSNFRVIKSTSKNPNIPVFVYDQNISLRQGQLIEDPLLTNYLKKTLELAEYIPGLSKVTLINYALKVELPNRVIVLFTTEKPILEQYNALQVITQNATIPLQGTEIDLRYKQPIIRER